MNTVVFALLFSFSCCAHLVIAGNGRPDPSTVPRRSAEDNAFAELADNAKEFISAFKRIKIIRDEPKGEEGRGNRGLMKIAVPLIAGFKAAAMVVSSLVVLKGLLLKSFAFSSLALTVSLGIAFKYLYDKVQGPLGLGHGTQGYDASSVYNSYAQGWGGGSDQVWQGSSAVELQPGFQGVQSGHDGYSLMGTGDLQGHFSEHVQKIANTSRLPYGEGYQAFQPSVGTVSAQYSQPQAQYSQPQAQYSQTQAQYSQPQAQYTTQGVQYQPQQQAQYSTTQYSTAQYSLQHGQRNL